MQMVIRAWHKAMISIPCMQLIMLVDGGPNKIGKAADRLKTHMSYKNIDQSKYKNKKNLMKCLAESLINHLYDSLRRKSLHMFPF